MINTNVAIIGGGASGLYAACLLSRSGVDCVLIEKNSRVGKKLLSTGNGRCNLTNVSAPTVEQFSLNYNQPSFAKQVFEAYGTRQTLAQFAEFGLLTTVENGCVYPSTLQASAVLDVLRLNVGDNVRVLTERCVTSVKRAKSGYELQADGELICAKYVFLCGGGLAAVKQNNCYELARANGHSIVPCRPALTPLKCVSPLLKGLNGVRVRCMVTLKDYEQRELYRSKGEVLFKDYGISGIPIFCASAYDVEKCTLVIDFFPDIDLLDLLRRRIELNSSLTLTQFFVGKLNRIIVANVLGSLGLNGDMLVSKADLCRIVDAFSHFNLQQLAPLPYDMSQVTAGGVSLSEVLPATMQSRLSDGLYLCGEMLDIHGLCGGYNLQFAWSSAALAAQDVIKRITNS